MIFNPLSSLIAPDYIWYVSLMCSLQLLTLKWRGSETPRVVFSDRIFEWRSQFRAQKCPTRRPVYDNLINNRNASFGKGKAPKRLQNTPHPTPHRRGLLRHVFGPSTCIRFTSRFLHNGAFTHVGTYSTFFSDHLLLVCQFSVWSG